MFDRLIRSAAVLILAFLCLFSTSGCGEDADGRAGDRDVTVSAAVNADGTTEISVHAVLHRDYVSAAPDGQVYLFALTPGTTLGETDKPVAEAEVKTRLHFRLPDVRDAALYAGYILADRESDGSYRALTQPVYLSNAEVLGEAAADARRDYPDAPSIKGLIIRDEDDAARLAPAHTLVRVPLGDFLCFDGGRDTVEYIFDGVTHYLRQDAVEELDRKVRLYSDAGMQVYLNLVLDDFPTDGMPAGLRALYAGEAQPDARGYAIRIADRNSFAEVAGFLSFLAERYTRADGEYGFAGAMIIGETVNRNRTAYSAGARDMSAHVSEYLTLLRIADTAMRSHFAAGRVYAAVGNNFSTMSPTPGTAADPLLDYAVRDFLDLLAAHSRLGGDFPWHVAMSMTASDPTDTRLWESGESSLSVDAYITPDRLELITDYLDEIPLGASDTRRRLIVSDFSVSSGNGSEEMLNEQAASYVYTYAKVLENGTIDALIYRSQTDEPADTLCCGLRSAAGEARPIYAAFAAIDRISGGLNVEALPGDVWTSLSTLVEDAAYLTLIEGTSVKAGSKTEACSRVLLYAFSDGEYHGFRAAENASYLALTADEALGQPVLRAVLSRANADACMGVRSAELPAECFARAEYLAVNCLAEVPGTRAYLWLRLTQADRGTLVYEGEAAIGTNEWNEVYFDIGDFADALRAGELDMQIWLQGSEGDPADGVYALRLDSIDLLVGPSYAWIGWLIGIAVAALLLLVAFLSLRSYRRHLENQRKVRVR